jgi:hypothetical protein
MERIDTIEQLQDAIILNKEIYFSLYHYETQGKHFQQLLSPEKHIDQLRIAIMECINDPIRGVYSNEIIQPMSVKKNTQSSCWRVEC